MNSTYQQLCHNLETLKLPQMHLHLSEIADFVATSIGITAAKNVSILIL